MTTGFRLDGHAALVTGAGPGLGRAIADALAELGAVVHGTGRDPATARRISERCGTAPRQPDITGIGSFPGLVDELEDAGGIDLLVSSAGINIPRRAADVTVEDWDAVMDADLEGCFFLTTAVARNWLSHHPGGAVADIASQAGLVAVEERAAYGHQQGRTDRSPAG